MATKNKSRTTRIAAVAVAAILAAVILSGNYVALATTLRSAGHDCCNHDSGNRSCLTLCAASESSALVSVANDHAPAIEACGLVQSAEPPAPAYAPAVVAKVWPDASPPLYVQFAAFLI